MHAPARLWMVLSLFLLAFGSACGDDDGTEDVTFDADAPVDGDADVAPDGDVDVAPDGDVPTDDGTGPSCGDGTVDDGEDCDDENDVAGDGCEPDCTFTCTEADDTCAAAEHCVELTHTCEPGCRADEGCAEPTAFCDTEAHACVECLEDGQCDAGYVCVDRACAEGCSATRVCPTGLDCCGGGCIDLQTSEEHCGACDDPCTVTAGTPECVAGACTVGACDPGFDDCDGMAETGCEVETAVDLLHCGACGNACPERASATATCAVGACGFECLDGYLDCNGLADDGCESLSDGDVSNCGRCGNVCDVPAHATAACTGGSCGLGACDAGWSDCNVTAADGCEIEIAADPANCGSCGFGCPLPGHAAAACAGGTCGLGACDAGWEDCNLVPGDGCEVDTTTDAGNCSACGASCAVANGTPACVTSACAIASCTPSWMDCNTTYADGCEIDTARDPANCGGCGRICSLPEAVEGCAAGACTVASCNAGFGDCNSTAADGCEIDVTSSVSHCGGCGRVCNLPNAVEGCAASACTVASCNAGFDDCNVTAADGCEVNLNTSSTNCGACGNVCTGGRTCATGSCNCAVGTTFCGGTCISTLTDVNNCGGCGNRCGFEQICSSGFCVNALSGPSFQVTGFTATSCAVVSDHTASTGDDRGGIAVTGTRLFYTGDTATGRFAVADLTGGASTGVRHDGLVSNLRTGQLYALATATGEIAAGGGTVTVTRLLVLNPDTGVATGSVLTLSSSFTINSSTYGGSSIFSGYDRIGVHNGTNFYHVALPSGTVTDMGAMTMPTHVDCENLANWGVLEFVNGNLYVDYVRNSTSIARTQVPGGATTVLATFTNLSDMCSITVSPSRNRWYFHHEGVSQFTGTGAEVVGYCNASWSQPSDTFQITSLGSTGCATAEHFAVTGDDRGGIAVGTTGLFYSGDGSTGRFSIADFSGGTALGRIYDGLASDLRRGIVYGFGNSVGPVPVTGGTVDRLLEIDGATGALTGRSILLTQSIVMGGSTGIFSGWGRIVVLASGHAYDIALPGGTVVDLGLRAAPTHISCEGLAFFGTAEYYGGALYVDYVANSTTISRMAVATGTVTTIATFTNLSDMCSFTFSSPRNRWYFHHEGASQFTGAAAQETVGYCTGGHTHS